MRIKKKSAFGVAAAGAAAIAITGGTFATFSDTDGKTESAQAGSVVLGVGEQSSGGMDFANMAPGESTTLTYTFTNDGSLNGNLTMGNFSVTDHENNCIDPEQEASDSTCGANGGELSKNLDVAFTVDGESYGSTSLSSVPSNPGYSVSLPEGESVDVQVEVTLPSDTGNEVQTDGVDVTWDVNLEQATS